MIGYLDLDGKEFDNEIPIPLSFTGDVELSLTSEFAESVKFAVTILHWDCCMNLNMQRNSLGLTSHSFYRRSSRNSLSIKKELE